MKQPISPRGFTYQHVARWTATIGGVVAALVASALPAQAAVSDSAASTAQVDGTVWAVARVGDRTIIGGDFTRVGGLARSNAAALLPDGSVDPTFDPDPDGVVYGVAASEDGQRVFLGGEFSALGATARSDLAAVDARTGSVVATWRADTDGLVHDLEVKGSRLYAAGTFRTIDGQTRRRLAAVDVATGDVQLGFNPWPDWTVKDIAVSPDGSRIYATGGFGAIGGQPRRGAAELSTVDGRATTFDPTDGGVGIAAALSPDGSRFLFSTTNNRLWAYEPRSGNAPVWVVQTSGDTQAIGASDTEVYFGGHFRRLSESRLKRDLLASVRLTDGQPTNWAPTLATAAKGMGPWTITLAPDAVLVGGDFIKVNGVRQSGLAIFPGLP